MNYNTFVLKNPGENALTTDILFYVASERANRKELLFLSVSPELAERDRSRLILNAVKLLRRMKKQGKIQLFVTPEDYSESTTEAKYMQNKYPDIEPHSDSYWFIIRI